MNLRAQQTDQQQKIQFVFKVRDKKNISVARIRRLAFSLSSYFRNHKSFKAAIPREPQTPLLVLVFVSPGQSKLTNFRFRKKNYATDVLSFSETAPHSGLGELLLCPWVLRRQAKDQRHSFAKELDYMIIHGFLHLLGYDHEKSHREELKMMALQDKLFRKLSK